MPSPLSFSFHSSTGGKKKGERRGKEKTVFPITFCQIVFFFFFCHIENNCPQVKNAPTELQPFQRERGLLKCERLPGSQDPLEVLMKSVTLASQLYVSIHNPSPKTSP